MQIAPISKTNPYRVNRSGFRKENIGNASINNQITFNASLAEMPEVAALRQRLKNLNWKYSIETNGRSTGRFGDQGIKAILACATTIEAINKINNKLDELEAGKDIFAGNITILFRNSSEGNKKLRLF